MRKRNCYSTGIPKGYSGCIDKVYVNLTVLIYRLKFTAVNQVRRSLKISCSEIGPIHLPWTL